MILSNLSEPESTWTNSELANAVGYMHPHLMVIERHTPKGSTKGGIIKPTQYREREQRSSSWGKLLRISEFPTSDEALATRRDSFKVGEYVCFLNTNPIRGGFATNLDLQYIAVEDVLTTLPPPQFEKYVKDEDL